MYELNAQAAKEADQNGQFIQETGKYVGFFTRAEKLISSGKKTNGIGFTFSTGTPNKPGQTTRFDLWTTKENGEELMGFKALMAIMTCLQIRNIKPTEGKVDKYDYDTKKMMIVGALVFQDLIGKPIGCLLRKTEYEKMKDGSLTGQTAWKLELAGAFQASTELTAGEILDKKTIPAQLEGMVSSLVDRPLKKLAAKSNAIPIQYNPSANMDEDIPF